MFLFFRTHNLHHHLEVLSLLARSILKHQAISPSIQSLRIMSNFFLLVQVTGLLKNRISWKTRIFC
jgi:hypothetical protein